MFKEIVYDEIMAKCLRSQKALFLWYDSLISGLIAAVISRNYPINILFISDPFYDNLGMRQHQLWAYEMGYIPGFQVNHFS